MAPSTVKHHFTALRGFLTWCVKRNYIKTDPLRSIRLTAADPRLVRRAMTSREVAILLATAPVERRLLYEVALDSALRVGALRALRIANLDVAHCGLRIEPGWNKNRTEDFCPLSPDLCERLRVSAAGKPPDAPLLHVTKSQLHSFNRDMARAGMVAAATE